MHRPASCVAQLGREDLHVAREHDELDVVLVDRGEHARLERGLRRGIGHRERLERHPVEVDEVAQRAVVREHERDLDGQLPRPLAEQQVVHAVPGGRCEHEGAQRPPHLVEVPLHLPALGDGRERRLELLTRGLRLDLQAHEEVARVEARELLALGDVAAGRDDGARDRVHDAGAVGAAEGDDPVVQVLGRGRRRGHPPRVPGTARLSRRTSPAPRLRRDRRRGSASRSRDPTS